MKHTQKNLWIIYPFNYCLIILDPKWVVWAGLEGGKETGKGCNYKLTKEIIKAYN